MDVVKNVGAERRTRESVARMLLEHGPVTAAQVAESLGLGAAAVRRHLDALLADGQASYRSPPRRGPRGRGRPAKMFLLTAAGRALFEHTYDDLAVAALRFLSERDGEQAVRSFGTGPRWSRPPIPCRGPSYWLWR
jgi:predicted ArsR family transcriptional regulator